FRDSSDSLGYTSYDGTTYNRRMTMQLGGNVGIGLTGPGYKLDVNGDVNIAAANVLRFGGTQVCASAGCTAVSDRRLKEDIQPLEDSLDNILKLQGVSYNWIDKEKYGQSQQIGLIAQDLEKVYPQAVITDSKSGLKSVAYDHLVAPLIEAFKSLNGRLNELYNLFAKISAEQARDIASIKSNDAAKDQKIEALEQENAEIKARLEKIEKALNSK
ncbi:MAG: tail fiber domain-containing protein, partial [Pseudomonadota bacterium]|nr:tail fiber domain-containing protein [Pseudomonadota bacterium]